MPGCWNGDRLECKNAACEAMLQRKTPATRIKHMECDACRRERASKVRVIEDAATCKANMAEAIFLRRACEQHRRDGTGGSPPGLWETVSRERREGGRERVRLQMPCLWRPRVQQREDRANQSSRSMRQAILCQGRQRHLRRVQRILIHMPLLCRPRVQQSQDRPNRASGGMWPALSRQGWHCQCWHPTIPPQVPSVSSCRVVVAKVGANPSQT